jgi:hypothetical protein
MPLSGASGFRSDALSGPLEPLSVVPPVLPEAPCPVTPDSIPGTGSLSSPPQAVVSEAAMIVAVRIVVNLRSPFIARL